MSAPPSAYLPPVIAISIGISKRRSQYESSKSQSIQMLPPVIGISIGISKRRSYRRRKSQSIQSSDHDHYDTEMVRGVSPSQHGAGLELLKQLIEHLVSDEGPRLKDPRLFAFHAQSRQPAVSGVAEQFFAAGGFCCVTPWRARHAALFACRALQAGLDRDAPLQNHEGLPSDVALLVDGTALLVPDESHQLSKA
jgi:hypothetical protein